MTIGFFSPLPPARTGIADYAASLLAALRTRVPVKVNEAGDANLYHLGNNQLHREIYARALAEPGVVVLHDAVLHHFFLGSLGEDSYLEEFVHNYGEWNRGLAQELWRDRPRSALDPRYFRYAMVRRIAETSRAAIVHNPGAAAIVKAHAPGARVVEIPHLFPAEAAKHTGGGATRDVDPGIFLFAVFGHLRESKRLFSVLRAFEKVRNSGSNVALLIAGDFVSSDLERAIAPLLGGGGILRRDYTAEPEFWRLAASADACINLRYPAAGETSGIAVRLMGIGKPVLMTAGAETSGFPEDACLRVDAGPGEADMLAEYMKWLADFPECAREIGRRAERYIREEHSLEKVTDRYLQVMISI